MRDVLIDGTTWLTWEQPVWDPNSETGEPTAHRYRFRDADGFARTVILDRDAEMPATLEELLALAEPLDFQPPAVQPGGADPAPVSEAPSPEPAAPDETPGPDDPAPGPDAPA